jgi:hypothetical protein
MTGYPEDRGSRSATGYIGRNYLSFSLANATEIFLWNNNGLMALYLTVG